MRSDQRLCQACLAVCLWRDMIGKLCAPCHRDWLRLQAKEPS